MWRKCLTILLHVDIVFSQHYLLKSIYMHSPWNNLGTLFENHLIIHVRVYFWALYSVPLVLMPVPYFLLWCCSKFFWTQDMRPPGLFFICRIVLAIWGPLSFHMIFRMSFSISAKTAIGVLVAIALNLQIALGSVVMLTVLSAPWTQSMRGSSQPRDQTHISCISRQILNHWATWEAPSSCLGLTKLVFPG